jgi:hypothetical protein
MIIREEKIGQNVKYWAKPDIINGSKKAVSRLISILRLKKLQRIKFGLKHRRRS